MSEDRKPDLSHVVRVASPGRSAILMHRADVDVLVQEIVEEAKARASNATTVPKEIADAVLARHPDKDRHYARAVRSLVHNWFKRAARENELAKAAQQGMLS